MSHLLLSMINVTFAANLGHKYCFSPADKMTFLGYLYKVERLLKLRNLTHFRENEATMFILPPCLCGLTVALWDCCCQSDTFVFVLKESLIYIICTFQVHEQTSVCSLSLSAHLLRARRQLLHSRGEPPLGRRGGQQKVVLNFIFTVSLSSSSLRPLSAWRCCTGCQTPAGSG